MLEVVYRPVFFNSQNLSFARVGFVSQHNAKILIREPNLSLLPIQIRYQDTSRSDTSWKVAGKIQEISSESDFTATLTIQRLQPSTPYRFKTSNNVTGTFKTAPPTGEVQPGEGRLTFLTTSCIKARFPYNPISHPRAVRGLKHVARWIPRLHASFMLFLGDFIYVDVPLRHGTDVETYRHEYRQVYSSPDWGPASDSLPWIHVIDDHEIANDWDRGFDPPYPSAIDPWAIYHASVNPPVSHPNASYFEFTQGPASFFMLDTRRHRSPSGATPADDPSKTMLGELQLTSLLKFLQRREPGGVKWKFIISSVPFTRNWRINSADTWAGYLHERQIILEAMWDIGLRDDGVGVIVLSGDRHEFAATAFPPPLDGKWPGSAVVHEFSTSPLNMFYLPFRSYKEIDTEPCIRYLPDGNSKFGAIELETVKGGEQGVLRFRLFIDGVETWSHVLVSPSVGHKGL